MLKFFGKATDINGAVIPGARIVVRTNGVNTPLPPIFTENSSGALVGAQNPVLTDSKGQYVFIIAPGDYSLSVTGTSAVINLSKTVIEYVEQEPVISPAITQNRTVFTLNSSWTPPTGVTQATITAVGGGAGGQAGASGFGNGGHGGGGGATVRRQVTVSPGTTYSITVGAGGTGGVPSLGAAGSGGNTTFGTLVTANGAAGGGAIIGLPGVGTTAGFGGPVGNTVVADTSSVIFNGFGGICSGGTGREGGTNGSGTNGNGVETYSGGTGGGGGASQGGGGGGGATPFGAGANGGVNTTNSATGGSGSSALVNSGAGGGGGASGGTTGGTGGAGGSGLCIVEWVS